MATVEINPTAQKVEAPAAAIVNKAAKTTQCVTPDGRVVVLRRLTPSLRQRLFAIAGPELSKNEMWLGTSAILYSVVSVSGDAVTPNNIRELEVLADVLDDDGLEAVAMAYVKAFGAAPAESVETIKN